MPLIILAVLALGLVCVIAVLLDTTSGGNDE
jgi:hypothetical protein